MASVRLVNNDYNDKYDFNHTKIVREKQFKSDIIHVAESKNYTFYDNDNIYYLGNGYPISSKEIAETELQDFLVILLVKIILINSFQI